MKNNVKLLLLLIAFIGCKEPKKQLTISVDFKNRVFIQMNGDSVWVSDNRYIEDSNDGVYSIGHGVPEDTILRLINFKPTVIILGRDTVNCSWGDTLRYSICKPDTVYKPIYRDIKYADKVIIGGSN